jgi:SAM-dependent methyltransferase
MREYEAQRRGGSGAYAGYFAAMDAAMQQKVALTTAHFPTVGRVADMGSGSGRGTYDLACLHPELDVVGVDIEPRAIESAGAAYRRDNLSYRIGDIADRLFDAESLDAVLDSSVLHHVTSFTGYSTERLEQCLDHQVEALRIGGALVIRDFVVPDGPAEVDLDLRSEGPSSGLSTADLFRRFAADFRSSQNRDRPVPFTERGEPEAGWERFRLPLRAAQEFILRKDYRADWAVELLEEYTYWTRDDFVRALERRGLRVVVAMPIRNPWIIANRYRGQVRLHDIVGRSLPFPPTNLLVVGERVPPRGGVRLVERSSSALTGGGFIQVRGWRHRGSGRIYDLAERPGKTIDLIPWRRDGERVLVSARKGSARPLVNAAADHPNLVGTRWSGHITEPVAAIVADQEGEAMVARVLAERLGLHAADVVSIGERWSYLTSPGGIDERVAAYAIELARPLQAVPNATGNVRELDARQLLRACHVGGMFDARLELGCYRLLARLGLAVGPWIGAALPTSLPAMLLPAAADALRPPQSAPYEPAPSAGFLEARRGVFAEVGADGGEIGRLERDYLLPRAYSRTTVSALPYRRTPDGLAIGVEWRELPAAQRFCGNAAVATVPAWRLPPSVDDLGGAEALIARQLASEFAATAIATTELGGPYLATAGVTPELVLPYAVAVAQGHRLHWISLADALAHDDQMLDAHLAIAVHRLSQAAALS